MAEALYSKYRPKKFEDVVGQKHILQTLKNAITANKITHAYMFCGPRGTGKTTMARLLAKACMCKNAGGTSPSADFCGKCEDCNDIASGIHPDVYELDAASRTGVENVREEIISRVGFAATRGDKKIYIIDEVHMLSTAAFNALLKTLEEPPEHVIFILCTTDPQKVPETILSRCQRFDFAAISATDIFERLKYVCNQESVTAEDEALRQIAQNAGGAMRNALTSLEQAIAFTNGNITIANIKDNYASDADADFDTLIEAIGMRNLPGIFEWCENEAKNGADFSKICYSLTEIIRNMYVKCAGGNLHAELPDYIDAHLGLFNTDRLHRIMLVLSDLSGELKTSTNVRLSFEVAMAKISNPKSDLSLEALAERISNLEASKPSQVSEVPAAPAQTIEEEPEELQPEVTEEEVPQPMDETPVFETEEKTEERVIPKKVVNVVEDKKPEPEPEPEIKMPSRPEAVDFSQARQNLKEEANVVSPADAESKNLQSNTELQKLWHTAFSNIRRKYPAFGATLLTANPSYNDISNQFILTFPKNASFSVGVLKKPDSMEKIEVEIKAVMGEDVGFNIEIDENSSEVFEPSFENNFRGKKQDADEDVFPEEETNSYVEDTSATTSNDSITDILNNYGAYNITEE